MTCTQTLIVTVTRRQLVCENILVLELENAAGEMLPAFTAGAHINLHLPGSLVRPYSLCNDPAERHRYRLAIRRMENGRGGSISAHTLAVGSRLTISTPQNAFPLIENARRSVLMAAGIGITPLMAMAHRLRTLNAHFDLHFRVNRARVAIIEALADGIAPERVCLHAGEGRSDFDFASRIGVHEPGVHLYICGPQGFVDAARQAAKDWPIETVHSESFTPTAPVEGDLAFSVQTASDGAWHLVPAGKTIAQVLTNAGYAIPTSCEQGICGTCRTKVLDGLPDHRDLCLSVADQQSNAFITPCCSRSITERLVLDL
ncbi:ferredoxin:oxidoreductase FAD/NAD(P)-binding subunit [Pseudomonas sp. Cab53]|uniref:PDR/VanB family oxidoreductase n=1 Tax=Pseudomonas TaxID=286 RepID=UPI00191097EB|nr:MULTISPECIES: PDR/VanB family oxidoreductase [Pseudomonas]BBH32633.1 phthalate 4,5-dioxygenase [Pseudomonas sp. St290]BBP65767.1 ferredoxin:oxidoreductase FAD/NAD(P)-binding subunit [Pseudomonas sp. Cab53]GFM84550.1 ferredoxin:oxidoreductase FAD/NAD(P)-binding subunit [Pseudomonas cichorii]